MCIHSSIHRHLLWVLYRISIAFQCFFSTDFPLIIYDLSWMYTKIILKCWSYKYTSAKGMCAFAWTWGSMDIAWLCSTHGVPFHLRPMVSHGNTMGIHGNPVVSHGAQGHTHGVPWKIYGVWWKALGVPWKTQGTPWSIFVRDGLLEKMLHTEVEQ